MPPTLSKPSSAAPTSIFYITAGALLVVWSGIWYAYLWNTGAGSTGLHYVCLGFLVTGLVLLAIGAALGPIARWARHAELPPAEVTPAAAQPEQVEVTSRRV
jgi:hypothetical protein